MSSLTNRMQRKVLRAAADYEPMPQPTIVHKDGGYSTLRPTKGWRHFSAKRLRAIAMMHRLLSAA